MVCQKFVETLMIAPSQNQLENAKSAIAETEEKLQHNEKLLMEWVKCQSHFPSTIDPCYIRGFIRGSKHNLDTAKRKLEHHLTARSLYPEIYSNWTPYSKDIVQIMDAVSIAISPRLTENGERLGFFKVEDTDPSKFDLAATTKLFFMIYEYYMTADIPVNAEMAIFDCTNFSSTHFVKFAGPFLKTMITLLRQAYAIRLREVHIINAPPMLEKLLVVVKPLLHVKVRNSIFIHKGKSICTGDCFSKDVMPSNYGGNLKSLREMAVNIYNVLQENSTWYEKHEEMKISGHIPKKIENALYFKEQLGVEGSFRKLQID